MTSKVVDQTDKTTRMLSMEECDRNIDRCNEALKTLVILEAPQKKIDIVEAEIEVWKRAKEHAESGANITINSKDEIYLQEQTKPN